MPLQFERLVWWFVKGRFRYTEAEKNLITLESEVRALLEKASNEKLLEKLDALTAKKIPETGYKELETKLKALKREATPKGPPPKPKNTTSPGPKGRSHSESESENESDSESDEGLNELVRMFGKPQPEKKPKAKPASTLALKQETPLETKSRHWEQEYIDAATQANPKSRASKNIMNHPVNQPAVLRELPHPLAGGRYVQIRTQTSRSDDHFRIVLEVNDQGPIKGGIVAAIWGLSHDEMRRTNKFWVYTRVKKNDWVHHSGDERW